MKTKDGKIYLDDEVIAVIDDSRKVVRVLKKKYLSEVINTISSLDNFIEYSWETYSHED